MFHRRTFNKNLTKLKTEFGIFYNDNKSNIKGLPKWDHSYKIHERNMPHLAIEAYKVMNYRFQFREVLPTNLEVVTILATNPLKHYKQSKKMRHIPAGIKA